MSDMNGTGSTVLLVEADADERDRFGAWLEDEGIDLLVCTGPTEPDYTCIGARTGACPLAAEASVVILDMSLDSEAVVMGTAAEELLGMYLMSGHPVIVLGSHGGEEISGQLVRLRRHPRREELIGAVRSLAAPSSGSKLSLWSDDI
jgi:hypothetical protein